MLRYLLFDSGCSVCRGVARVAEEQSNGWLITRSLHDPEMQEILNQEKKNWKWEPTLIEVQADRPHVFTGINMRVRLLKGLGIKRSSNILRLLADATIPSTNNPRRTFLRRTGFVLASAVFGPGVIPQLAQASKAKDKPGVAARKEGVRSYKVEETPEGFHIKFTHKDASRSGTVVILGSQSPQTTVSLLRNNLVFAFIADRFNASFTVKDSIGRSGFFEFADGQWSSPDIEAKTIVDQNISEVTLTAAIYGDFEKAPTPTSSIASPQLTADAQNAVSANGSCLCSTGNNYVRGSSGAYGVRSLACQDATIKVNTSCSNSFCFGCCNLLDCDCACIVADYLCACGRIGYYCTTSCA